MVIKRFQKIVQKHSQGFNESLVFSTNALAGEVGELCNLSKKAEYYKKFDSYKKRVDHEEVIGLRKKPKERITDELGDCLFYLVQSAQRAGISLEDIINHQDKKLRAKSMKHKKVFKK